MMLLFRFRQSKSSELPWILQLARRGQFQDIDATHARYETAFDITEPDQLASALSLAKALWRDGQAEAFADGQSISLMKVHAVLRCYQQSRQIEDVHAFCWIMKDVSWLPHAEPDEQILFPCHQAAGQLRGLSVESPGTIAAQTQAALTRAEVHWCPRLTPASDWISAQAVRRLMHEER